MYVPIKTNDIVIYNGKKHAVKNIELTDSGPILELTPLEIETEFVHASEIKLANSTELKSRIKSISGDNNE